jgi:hypothetical protein
MNPESTPQGRPGDSSCIATENCHVYLLTVEADDGQTYALPTAHLQSAVLGRALGTPDAPGTDLRQKGPSCASPTSRSRCWLRLARLVERLAMNTLKRLRTLPARFRDQKREVPIILSIRVRTLSDA